MYLVVSQWEPLPGREEDFQKASPKVRAALRNEPGAVMVESFKGDGHYVVVHGYSDEAAYHAIVDNPDSGFRQALAENHLEEMGHWLGSERGVTIPH